MNITEDELFALLGRTVAENSVLAARIRDLEEQLVKLRAELEEIRLAE